MAKKKTEKKSIQYGKVELEDDEFDLQVAKVRITTFVDLDVLQALKASAKKLNMGYQTLLNEKLREVILGEERRDAMAEILLRLEKLEKKVG